MSSLCGSEAAGKVRLSAPAWMGQGLLGAVAAAYLAACPKVAVELRMHAGEESTMEGDADLALCLEADLKPSLVARKVAQVNVGLYASPAYLERKGEPVHPQTLAGHDALTSGSARADAAWCFSPAAGGPLQRAALTSVLNANQPETLMSAAVHGAGVALLPDLLAEEAVASGKQRRLMPGWSAQPLSLHLSYECRQHLPLSGRNEGESGGRAARRGITDAVHRGRRSTGGRVSHSAECGHRPGRSSVAPRGRWVGSGNCRDLPCRHGAESLGCAAKDPRRHGVWKEASR